MPCPESRRPRRPKGPTIWRTQSHATSSSSVSAGLACQFRPEHAEPAADEVAEHARQRGVGREVAEEPRVLPVRQTGHDDRDRGRASTESNGSGSTGGPAGSAALTAPGSVAAMTGRAGETGAVVRDPVDELVAEGAELVWCHGWSLAAILDGGIQTRYRDTLWNTTPCRADRSRGRRFLGAVGAGALGGCRGRQRSLTVFVYAGLDEIFQRHFADPFESKTGVKVNLDAGWWDAIGKLKASPKGKPVYDLVLTDATQGYPAIKSGMFRQLDFDRIPNHKALAPIALDNWVAKDRYGITFHESAMTLVWDRRQLVREPSSWGDLLRPELAGKLSFYDSFYFSLFTFACMKAAADGKPGTAHRMLNEHMGAVLDYAKRERDRVRSWWPTGGKMLQDLLQGNFAAGQRPQRHDASKREGEAGSAWVRDAGSGSRLCTTHVGDSRRYPECRARRIGDRFHPQRGSPDSPRSSRRRHRSPRRGATSCRGRPGMGEDLSIDRGAIPRAAVTTPTTPTSRTGMESGRCGRKRSFGRASVT